MSNSKCLLFAAIPVLIGMMICAGVGSLLYRGFNEFMVSRKIVKEQLETSGASIASAYKQLADVLPAYQDLIDDFALTEITAFRHAKRETSAKLSENFTSVSKHFDDASHSYSEAAAVAREDLKPFLMANATMYEQMARVNKYNVTIIEAFMDESIANKDAVIQKVNTLGKIRDSYQKAADEASAEANAILEQSKRNQ